MYVWQALGKGDIIVTPGQAAYEEFQRLQSRKIPWDLLDAAGRERWEAIAQAARNAQ